MATESQSRYVRGYLKLLVHSGLIDGLASSIERFCDNHTSR